MTSILVSDLIINNMRERGQLYTSIKAANAANRSRYNNEREVQRVLNGYTRKFAGYTLIER